MNAESMDSSLIPSSELEELEVEEAPQEEITPGEAVRKIIELEISEEKRLELIRKFLSGELEDVPFIAFLPTRDVGHGRTFPIDEFKASSDYEIALHLLNLNKKMFAKAALFFFLMAIWDVTITRSRDGFLIKELRTFWSGMRKAEEEEKKWFISPKALARR